MLDLPDEIAPFGRTGVGGFLQVAKRWRPAHNEGVKGEQFAAVPHAEAVKAALVVLGQAAEPEHKATRVRHVSNETVVEHPFCDRHEAVEVVPEVALNDRVGTEVIPFDLEGEDLFLIGREHLEVTPVLLFDKLTKGVHQFLLVGFWTDLSTTERHGPAPPPRRFINLAPAVLPFVRAVEA